MPKLDFQITEAEARADGLAPLIQFTVSASAQAGTEKIQAVLLHAQIQIQSPQRTYSDSEKGRLIELFGRPECWGQTLRNRLWTTADTTIGAFIGETTAKLSVPCTFDLAFPATKYFYGLEGGDVPLLFLFSGTIFYETSEGRLQVQPISWSKEAIFRMPRETWEKMMEQHFPNTAWLYLRRDVFDRLYAFRRSQGDATWEQTLERLLPQAEIENAGTAA